ncbi:hypothetical protein IAT38_001747 [Cryptococcus sp. DSM 104549]
MTSTSLLVFTLSLTFLPLLSQLYTSLSLSSLYSAFFQHVPPTLTHPTTPTSTFHTIHGFGISFAHTPRAASVPSNALPMMKVVKVPAASVLPPDIAGLIDAGYQWNNNRQLLGDVLLATDEQWLPPFWCGVAAGIGSLMVMMALAYIVKIVQRHKSSYPPLTSIESVEHSSIADDIQWAECKPRHSRVSSTQLNILLVAFVWLYYLHASSSPEAFSATSSPGGICDDAELRAQLVESQIASLSRRERAVYMRTKKECQPRLLDRLTSPKRALTPLPLIGEDGEQESGALMEISSQTNNVVSPPQFPLEHALKEVVDSIFRDDVSKVPEPEMIAPPPVDPTTPYPTTPSTSTAQDTVKVDQTKTSSVPPTPEFPSPRVDKVLTPSNTNVAGNHLGFFQEAVACHEEALHQQKTLALLETTDIAPVVSVPVVPQQRAARSAGKVIKVVRFADDIPSAPSQRSSPCPRTTSMSPSACHPTPPEPATPAPANNVAVEHISAFDKLSFFQEVMACQVEVKLKREREPLLEESLDVVAHQKISTEIHVPAEQPPPPASSASPLRPSLPCPCTICERRRESPPLEAREKLSPLPTLTKEQRQPWRQWVRAAYEPEEVYVGKGKGRALPAPYVESADSGNDEETPPKETPKNGTPKKEMPKEVSILEDERYLRETHPMPVEYCGGTEDQWFALVRKSLEFYKKPVVMKG